MTTYQITEIDGNRVLGHAIGETRVRVLGTRDEIDHSHGMITEVGDLIDLPTIR